MLEETHQHPDHEGAVHVHISPARTYWLIFATLIALTIITVAVSYVHLGDMNLVVAMVIATIKATFVVLYFMHMKYEAKFNVIVFIGSLLFAAIFLIYTQNDTETRGRVDQHSGVTVDPDTGKFAYGTAPALIEAVEQSRLRAARPATTAGDTADFDIWAQEPVRPEAVQGAGESAPADSVEPQPREELTPVPDAPAGTETGVRKPEEGRPRSTAGSPGSGN